jgi:hypothetical protein
MVIVEVGAPDVPEPGPALPEFAAFVPDAGAM